MKYSHVKDRRPITTEEARRGMEAVRSWPEEARAEIFELPDNEAAIMLLCAGELGAVPVAAVSTETAMPSAETKGADPSESPQEPTTQSEGHTAS